MDADAETVERGRRMIKVTYNTSEKTTCRCCGKAEPDWGLNFLTDGQSTGGTKVFLCTRCEVEG